MLISVREEAGRNFPFFGLCGKRIIVFRYLFARGSKQVCEKQCIPYSTLTLCESGEHLYSDCRLKEYLAFQVLCLWHHYFILLAAVLIVLLTEVVCVNYISKYAVKCKALKRQGKWYT